MGSFPLLLPGPDDPRHWANCVITSHTTAFQPQRIQVVSWRLGKGRIGGAGKNHVLDVIVISYACRRKSTRVIPVSMNPLYSPGSRPASRPGVRSARSGLKSVAGPTVEARIVCSARVDARRGRAPGRDPKGGALRPTVCVATLARCPRIALRAAPTLTAGERRADHDPGEKCGLEPFGGRRAGPYPASSAGWLSRQSRRGARLQRERVSRSRRLSRLSSTAMVRAMSSLSSWSQTRIMER